MIFQPQGIDDGTFHYKFLETEFPDIVSDQIGGSLGLHDPMIQNSPGQYIHRHLFREKYLRGIDVLHFSPRLDNHSVKMSPRPRNSLLILTLEDVNITRWCRRDGCSEASSPTCVPVFPPLPSILSPSYQSFPHLRAKEKTYI